MYVALASLSIDFHQMILPGDLERNSCPRFHSFKSKVQSLKHLSIQLVSMLVIYMCISDAFLSAFFCSRASTAFCFMEDNDHNEKSLASGRGCVVDDQLPPSDCLW